MSREAALLLENLSHIARLLLSEPDADRPIIEGGLKQLDRGLGQLRCLMSGCHDHDAT